MELMEWLERREKPHRHFWNGKYTNCIIVGLICLITLLWGVIYCVASKTVYFWDDATYWEISRMLALKPLNSEFFKEVYTSIITADYNYLPALPVSLWMRVFGGTRLSYIIAITIMYLIPAQVMIYNLAKKLSKAPLLAFVISVISVPALSYLTCIGFIDVGGVLIATACYYFYYTDGFKKRPWIKYIIIGVLLSVIMLYRRYFAFFAVSFVTSMIIDSILFKRSVKGMFITVMTTVCVLAVFFFPFIINILLKDYGNLYSGYKYDVMTDLKIITRYFGLSFLLMVFAFIPYTIKRKKDMRCIFPLLQIVICAVMFITTQTHGQQHLFLYIPGLVTILMLGINSVKDYKILSIVCIISAITFVSPLIPRKQPQNIQEIKGLAIAPAYSAKAEKRSDINQIIALKNNLDKTIPEGKTCGILASSFTVNASILINAEPSLNRSSVRNDNYIVGLPEVDSRDWWRLEEIYACDYILVAVPAQTHLAEGEQKIIEEAVRSFTDGTDIAGFYTKVNGFKGRIGEVELALYERTGEVSETAKVQYKKRLNLKEG